MSYVDDMHICGTRAAVSDAKSRLFKHFKCDDVGEANEYIGNKVDQKDGTLKLTQPVLLQSFQDEFELPHERPMTPASAGTVLQPGTVSLEPELQTKYQRACGKLIHLMKWSRPDCLNSIQDLTRYMTKAKAAHLKAIY